MSSDDPADLRAVRGIGPKAEARLKEAGIADLATLARTPVNELAAALAGLRGKFDADRINHEEWITQAAALAAASRSAADPAERDAAQPVRHGFTVEVRLTRADREVVSTRVTHVPTGDEDTWGGWDPERLAAFVADRSGLRSARSAPEPAPALEPAPAPALAPAEPAPKPEPAPVAGPTREADREPDRLVAYGMVPAAGPGFAGGRSRDVTATLTFSQSQLGHRGFRPATVRAEILARQLLAGGTVVVGRGTATLDPGGPGGPAQLDVRCDLSPARPPLVLCAAVRIVVPGDGERAPVQELTGARLLITS